MTEGFQEGIREEPWTVKRILAWSTSYLLNANMPSARLDCEILLTAVLNCSRIDLYLHFEKPLTKAERLLFREKLLRRVAGEPIAYIVGSKEFYGFSFFVSPDVLIPRPETEELIDKVLEAVSPNDSVSVLDIGTGSGCIAITLAKKLPLANVEAWDICPKALSIADDNARRLAAPVTFSATNALGDWPDVRFDLIVANPPYIAHEEKSSLPTSVKDFEPATALFCDDGLAFYKSIARNGLNCIKSGGGIFLEIGYKQAQAVQQLLGERGWTDILVSKDYSGLDRVVTARAP